MMVYLIFALTLYLLPPRAQYQAVARVTWLEELHMGR